MRAACGCTVVDSFLPWTSNYTIDHGYLGWFSTGLVFLSNGGDNSVRMQDQKVVGIKD